MTTRTTCTGCGGEHLSAPWKIPHQPVVLNYRFASPEDARRVPCRDLKLVQCADCGLVFNAALDIEAIPYDEQYENRQCFSDAFQVHLDELAARLAEMIPSQGAAVLEVGCGKGDFLVRLCRTSGARGEGYDTSYGGPSTALEGRVKFFREYVGAADVRSPFHLVLCRHVVEHIGDIEDFLTGLCEIARAAGDALTVIETPSFEWIAENTCFWDVFHEHANYFTEASLAYLARLSGFSVVSQERAFGDQYQLLVLRPSSATGDKPPAPHPGPSLKEFSEQAERKIAEVSLLVEAQGSGSNWAVWGAGAKGVSLSCRLQDHPPRFVIDANPAKQGCYIPGSGIEIVAPEDERIQGLDMILVANPNYLEEISSSLNEKGYRNTILTL